jgi:hypothetical protein
LFGTRIAHLIKQVCDVHAASFTEEPSLLAVQEFFCETRTTGQKLRISWSSSEVKIISVCLFVQPVLLRLGSESTKLLHKLS